MKFRKPIPKGTRFGRLTVVRMTVHKGASACVCKCDCGKVSVALTNNLRRGITTSCGCRLEVLRKTAGDRTRTHGMSKSHLYNCWCGIVQRSGKKNDHFPKYKNRPMCEEWRKFENFRDWALANGYREDLTVDRVNNDLGYFPENCRWVDRKTQNRNKGNNVAIVYKGKRYGTLIEFCEAFGLSPDAVYSRYRKYGRVELLNGNLQNERKKNG